MPIFSFEKSVGAAIYRREAEKILYLVLLKKPRKPDAVPYWGFPQGHIESGESELQTLKREIREETGIEDLSVMPDFKIRVKYFYRATGREKEWRNAEAKGLNVVKRVVLYLAETKTENITLSREHIEFAWLEYREAGERITYENSKRVLAKANRYLTAR